MTVLPTIQKCINESDPIIMVDDSEMDLDISKRFYRFSKLKNPFLAMKSGEELLTYLAEVKQNTKPPPAMVLLDVNMPSMDGFTVLKKTRSQPEFASIPVVVMLTNSNSSEDIQLSLKLGANGFQTKSFGMTEYVRFFDSLCPS